MPSSVSIISLSNRALLQIGGRSQISNLNEGTPAANAVNTLWIPTFEQLARTAWWNCLRRQAVPLTLLKAAEGTPENPAGTTLPLAPVPFLYEYLLPPDCLHARFLVPTLPPQNAASIPLTTANNNAPVWLPNNGQIPFQVGYDTDASGNPLNVIFTDLCQAQLVYTIDQPNPSIWDTQFQAAFVASLAAFLVPALTLDLSLMTMQVSIAERIIAEARASDANEGSNTQDHIPDWIRVRTGAAQVGCGNYNYARFFNMCWPGG